MCGRYSLALRPSQVRRMLQDDDMPVDDAPDDEGEDAPRHTYNFAPGNFGIVYRADVPDHGAGPARDRGTKTGRSEPTDSTPAAEEDAHATATDTHYKLQSMKWGLIPFWTKRNPDYASMLKTINCRDDSLATPGGLWSTMKARKRCIVVAQGFYEWLRPNGPGTKEKVPHYVKRKDGKLMCFAGLWDSVQYEGEEKRLYTYTVITTDSNKQLKFLHDRMPVILEQGSEGLRKWLDPGRCEWSKELQGLLRPWDGELEVYPVSKEVGKVGNNSPNFVIPVASRENKANIANFFARGMGKGSQEEVKEEADAKKEKVKKESKLDEVEIKQEKDGKAETKSVGVDELAMTADDGGMNELQGTGIKREAASSPKGEPPTKKMAFATSPAKSSVTGKPPERKKISATSNVGKSPAKKKGKADGSQKITKFFGNSA
ncbi:embryonic stem cell-specific 5-hydroxymethylcytosine-binding protein [Podospora aff. communis PSN243]|uniref:Embryonic stem cell-specific 5-hydroxymethylcytosine-binding protein n=1 Tax=Podospora aff. communis PSN243 TaxID=3040156 RepID=A0AAV9GIR3_9PEZI|nr:embryonic stem cell-specific 5-hydroxymethylcytosine-binding protein [Podospora aff. communis PSN243]